MLVRAIAVDGLNCFGEEVRVDGLGNGVTVIHGPNGVGKSSLLQGMASAFLRSHRSEAAAICDMKPWNRRLNPAVTVEFEHAGQSYRLIKTFLHRPTVTLEAQKDGVWSLFSRSDDAEAFLQEMLQVPAGRPANAPGLSGLAQVLWTTQGQCAVPPLSGDVVSSIQASIGAHICAASTAIDERVKVAFAHSFTPTGKLKKGNGACRQVEVEARLVLAESETNRLQRSVAEYENTVEKISDLQAKVEEGVKREQAVQARLKELRAADEQFRLLSSSLREQKAIASAAEQKFQAITDQRQLIEGNRKRLVELSLSRTGLEQEVAQNAADLRHATGELEQAEAVLRTAEAEHASADVDVQHAAIAKEYADARRQQAELHQKLHDIACEKAIISARTAQLGLLAVPTDEALQELGRRTDSVRSLRQKLELARVRVTFTAESGLPVLVSVGTCVGVITAEAGQTLELAGNPNLVFSIAGAGQFEASGPVTTYAAIEAELNGHIAWLQAIAAQYETDDLQELQTRKQTRQGLHSAIESNQLTIRTLLSGRTEDALSFQAREISQRLALIEQQFPDWVTLQPDASNLAAAASQRKGGAEIAVNGARLDATARRTGKHKLDLAFAKAQSSLEALDKQTIDAHHALEAALRDGKTDEERRQESIVAAAALTTAHASVTAIQCDLAAFGTEPAIELQRIDREEATDSLQRREQRDQLQQLKGSLKQLSSIDPYIELSRAEEAKQAIVEELTVEGVRNEALKLLKQTLEESRSTFLFSVAQPVQERASAYLERICGQPIARIQLKSDFALAGVYPAGLLEDKAVAETRMSAGEQEQIHLCTRLALATQLAKDERQLVVLDDALNVTDEDRMRRINQLIADCSEHLQIIILTCQPKRFASIPGVNFLDLAALVALPETERAVA